jgi:hypothetical protein
MKQVVIVDPKGFPVKPMNVDVSKHFWDAFGNNESECSAHYIVKLCQEKGGWFPFTMEEIETVYRRAGHTNFYFNWLVDPGRRVTNAAQVFAGDLPKTVPIGGGWIVKDADGKFHITEDFVNRCYKSSPATK